ncbi:pyruvate dehydrogenase (acetyl-transferring) E1 component subunit alpha [Thiohalobacter sp. IOR34]|uniref:pyruvate dehydrogenase (acetyl-transferring) E1 component subunit alpha n=1 Tax=Thiohalobacter sp. IOR34 TaxID=3057176 RepID=UPI0025B2101B|nr:pyruvate dehydrogenase (acetyl-transferring) E1 component subunit alpha [Thiohalobacter sp. IOR34]WJW76365.1 pyruvate dehydrogenase (acetyl-transferring) E1 component subunit alpha [Thiohalobacter sp. IOR34]
MNLNRVRQFLSDMLLARYFEEAAAEQYARGRIAGFLHLYPGEEAVAVGTLRAADPGDYVVSTYREHVHALVRGISPRAVMAELFGRETGCSRGYGGSMHLFDAERRFLGGYAIVGETFPVAIGAGYWLAMNRSADVVLCYFGDGATNQGTFHESLNMAALWRLPVLFVCENNHYQIGTEIHQHSALTEVYKRACAYGIEGERVDGMDVLAVYEATERALRLVRDGKGPYLLECETYRFRGHSMADAAAYRSSLEVQELRARDPLFNLRRQILAEGWLDEATIEAEEKAAREAVEDAVRFAEQSPEPGELMRDLYVQPLDLYGGGA